MVGEFSLEAGSRISQDPGRYGVERIYRAEGDELALFPLYEEWSRQEGATEWLCAQHDDMRAGLWTLGTLSAQAEPQRYCAELASLQDAFDRHAAEEERRMYPVFERMLRG